MRNRSAALALVFLFLSSVELPFSIRLSAQNQPAPYNLWFTEVPAPGSPLSLGAFAPLVNPIGVADHTFAFSMQGTITVFDPRTGATRQPFAPFGAGSQDEIAFSMGFVRATVGATTPDVLVTGPLQPSNRPFQLFQFTTPPTLLGEEPDTWAQAGGLRLDIADVDADQNSEFMFASGPGGPGLVSVVAPGPNTRIEFGPFGADFRGGVSIATGDFNGDGKAEILAGQETGGEVRVFDVVGNQVRLRAMGHPFGPAFNGGIRVAAGDVDGDGFADLITAPAQGEPRIRVFCLNGPTPVAPIADFLAFDPSFRDGVFVDTGISAGRPVILTSSGNRFALFEARPNEGIRSIENVLARIVSGQTYVNIHSTVNVGGEIRGQIRLAPLRK